MMAPMFNPDALARSLEKARRELRDTMKLGMPSPDARTIDLSESRVFLLSDDGTLDIDAVLHPDDYGDLIRWRAGGSSINATTLVVVGFFTGAVAATLISLIAR